MPPIALPRGGGISYRIERKHLNRRFVAVVGKLRLNQNSKFIRRIEVFRQFVVRMESDGVEPGRFRNTEIGAVIFP